MTNLAFLFCLTCFGLQPTWLDLTGKAHSANEWKNQKAIVLFFLGTECPVSNGYTPEMSRIAREFSSRGVLFWGVYPDPTLDAISATTHAKQYGLTFLTLLDPNQTLARQTGVRVVPEAVVLSSSGQILYRGRIDDRYTETGKRRIEPTTRDLELALTAVLEGKDPPVTLTRAFGCPLPKPRPKK